MTPPMKKFWLRWDHFSDNDEVPRWCPFVRAPYGSDDNPASVNVGWPSEHHEGDRIPEWAVCITVTCAAWRTEFVDPDDPDCHAHGYCGLAGPLSPTCPDANGNPVEP